MDSVNLNNKIGAGLQNMGNTCFFNAVTQVILHTNSLAEALHTKVHSSHCNKQKWCIVCSMEELFVNSKKSRVVMPNNIVHNLRTIFKKFRLGRQEDSHEFLRFLIQGMQEAETGKMGKDRQKNELAIAKSLAFKVFGGRLRNFVQCLSCEHRSLTSERYYDMSIECQRSSSLQDGLTSFFRVDELTGANKYRCDNCKQLSNARKGSSILTIPHVITFQLKRFTNTLRKIGKMISYPKMLDLSKFMDGDSQHKNQSKLQLYGVVVHAGGSANCGHYYSYIKCKGQWYEMNDSNVHKVREQTALNQQAYLLFYRKINDEHHISINNHNIISMEEKQLIRQIKEDEERQKQKKAHGNKVHTQDVKVQRKKSLEIPKSKNKEEQKGKLQVKKDHVRESKSVPFIKNGNNQSVKTNAQRKKSIQQAQKDLEETKRKISMDISALKEECKEIKVNKKNEQLTKNGNPKTMTIGGKTLQKKVFGQVSKKGDDDDNNDQQQLLLPMKLKKKRSKEEANSSMNLMEMVLKYSSQLIHLQSKLPRKGPGHRMMRPMYNLRKYQIALKKRKLG